jgi:hypothetical protein
MEANQEGSYPNMVLGNSTLLWINATATAVQGSEQMCTVSNGDVNQLQR